MPDLVDIDRGYPGEGRPRRERDPSRGRAKDSKIADLAAAQHGVVARRQLRAIGFSRHAVDRRIATGRLHRIFRGVYAVGHRRVIGRGRWMAAVLACGPHALLSHRSAAALWELATSSSPLVDVTAPRSRAGHEGIALHLVRDLNDEDRARRDGIPVTSVARTLFDLAEVVDRSRLERAFEQAERLRLLDVTAIERMCERGHGRRALKLVAPLLSGLSSEIPETRSELERRFIDLCRETGLPLPEVNVIVEGFEVDALWRERRLVVELDGYEYHRTRAAFERDRARDAALQLAGHRVVRITARQLAVGPGEVARMIQTLLGLG